MGTEEDKMAFLEMNATYEKVTLLRETIRILRGTWYEAGGPRGTTKLIEGIEFIIEWLQREERGFVTKPFKTFEPMQKDLYQLMKSRSKAFKDRFDSLDKE